MDGKLSRGEVESSPRWDEQDLLLHIDESLRNREFEMDELAFYEALFTDWEAEQAASDPGDEAEDYSPEEDEDWLDELRGLSL